MRLTTLLSLLILHHSVLPCANATEVPTTTSPATAGEAADLTLVRIWPSWHSANSFLRIGEYFGGSEARNGQTLLRSQPEERSGFYFLIRIKNSDQALADANFELQVIRPDSPHAVTYTFPANIVTGSHAYLLGLTGSDWPGFGGKLAKDTHPVSWQLRLLDSQSHELLRSESFLWAKPQK